MPFRPVDALLPVTPIAFEILLALVEEDRHGYAILQAVEARVKGRLPLRTGTLYRALARLVEDGLIEEVDGSHASGGAAEDSRRRIYAISKRGRSIARAETDRLADQVAAARSRRLLPGRS